MKAIVQDVAGGPEVLRLTEVVRPEPGPTEVLVRVHAAGVNPVDWKVRTSGAMLDGSTVSDATPFILGWDVSGVIEAVGFGVTRFQPGDEVFGMPRFPHQAGAYSQYVTAPSRHFVRKPANLDHIQAAALPLAALTAWQSLVEFAEVTAGQRVLIHGAAGGVGHLAVQIAKARGAEVIGTARQSKHDFLRRIGVDTAIDYTTTDVTSTAGDVDVVLDPFGDYAERSLEILRSNGVLVVLAAVSPELVTAAAQRSHRAATVLVEPDSAGMQAIADLAATHTLRPEVDSVLPLAEASTAHERSQTNRTQGKIVLAIP